MRKVAAPPQQAHNSMLAAARLTASPRSTTAAPFSRWAQWPSARLWPSGRPAVTAWMDGRRGRVLGHGHNTRTGHHAQQTMHRWLPPATSTQQLLPASSGLPPAHVTGGAERLAVTFQATPISTQQTPNPTSPPPLASSASARWAEEQAMTTEASPTSTVPVRWAMATLHSCQRVRASRHSSCS